MDILFKTPSVSKIDELVWEWTKFRSIPPWVASGCAYISVPTVVGRSHLVFPTQAARSYAAWGVGEHITDCSPPYLWPGMQRPVTDRVEVSSQ